MISNITNVQQFYGVRKILSIIAVLGRILLSVVGRHLYYIYRLVKLSSSHTQRRQNANNGWCDIHLVMDFSDFT